MLYRSLGVKQSATPEEIRTAYRQLALQCHPDRSGGTPEAIARFQDIQKAYEVLSDEQRRAAYDEDISAKRAKFKGFVKPTPFCHAIEKPVGYKLVDESMYTFESAPSQTHCGWNYGDVLSFKDQTGCYVGVAADQFHYWCASGTSYASRLVQAGSTFGTSEVKVMYRCNLNAKPVGTGGNAVPRQRPRTEKEKAEGKKKLEQMKQALQQRERARASSRLLERLIAEERADRDEVENLLWVKLEELHSTSGTLLHCLEMGVPLPDVGREWLNRALGTDGSWSNSAPASTIDAIAAPTDAVPNSPSPAAARPADDGSNVSGHFSDRLESDSFSAPDHEESGRDQADLDKRSDGAVCAGKPALSCAKGVERISSSPTAAKATPGVDSRQGAGAVAVAPSTSGSGANSQRSSSSIRSEYDAGSDPLHNGASAQSDKVVLRSTQFRHMSSHNATSSPGVDISYQFHEIPNAPHAANEENDISVLYVDLSGEGDDLFEFVEETPAVPAEHGELTELRMRANEKRLQAHARSAQSPPPPAPPLASRRTRSSPEACTSSRPNGDDTPAFASVRVARSKPDHSGPPGRAEPVGQSAATTAVHGRSLTSPQLSTTPQPTSSGAQPQHSQIQPPPSLTAPHRTPDQFGSLGQLLISRTSSSGNLYAGSAPTPRAALPHATSPSATTPLTTAVTTTVASTSAMTSLPPPVVSAALVGEPLQSPQEGVSPRSNPETPALHTWPRASGVPALTIPSNANATLADRGPSSKRGATYPWSVSPAAERLDACDDRVMVSSSSAPPRHISLAADDERRVSDECRHADLAGTVSGTELNGSAAVGASAADSGGTGRGNDINSNLMTPSSAHLSNGAGTNKRTPRFMQATKSYSNRTNGSTRYTPHSTALSPRFDQPHEDAEGSALVNTAPPTDAAPAAASAADRGPLSATYSGPDPHAHKTAQQMFNEEMAFMKEFEKKRKHKFRSTQK